MRKLIFFFCLLVSTMISAQQKIIADYTIEMNAEIADASGNIVFTAAKTISVSGKKVRVDFSSSKMNQSTIIDNISNSSVILREESGNRYMRKLNAEQWQKENQRFNGISFQFNSETKKILGYDCKKATAQLKDGSTLTVYFVPSVSVTANENDFQFNSIPGLIMEYQLKNAERTIHFIGKNINFDPVPASRFEIPSTGYRII
jgi:GLPGLI family protein